MSVSRDIAQANTYASAFQVLMFQVVAVSIAIGAYSPHWWYGVMVPFVFGLGSLLAVFRVIVVVTFSAFWALLIWQIARELGANFSAYLFGVLVFISAYVINAAGMIGLHHSVPDLN